MMFNGLIMCADSDTSDLTKESGASSPRDTGGSWDAAARATYYHNKLMSTLQVLANKEETVRVQNESLRVAEARIASLTARAQRLRDELDEKTKELKMLEISSDKYRTEMADMSVTADIQEVENQKNIVKTLQTNLSVIEDLYRECFYETAKQEELIEMLRKSYLDVRLMDKEKCDQIGHLQNVINTQRWSLERCQDMAMEVEGLKLEISNFLSSSNNDSGMWERSEDSLSGEVVEDLQHITAQLLQLRAMLTGDCTCGLLEENIRLKNVNETMEIQVGELQQRVSELEAALGDKENQWDQTCRDEIAEKEQELNRVRERLAELQESTGDRKCSCEVLSAQLRQAQVSIEDQSRELVEARHQVQEHELTISRLKEELEKANRIVEEGRALREEACELRRDARAHTRRARALVDELARAHDHCRSVDACYKEKARCAATLQAQLEEAHARGAELCAEAQRAAHSVRLWVRRVRARNREQQSRIKELEVLNGIVSQQNDSGLVDLEEPCCVKCLSLTRRIHSRGTETDEFHQITGGSEMTSCECAQREASASGTARSKRTLRVVDRHSNTSKTAVCNCVSQDRIQNDTECGSSKAEERRRSHSLANESLRCDCSRVERKERSRTSGSEIASTSSAPTPPRRLLKKKLSPTEEKVESWWWGPSCRSTGAQQPLRCDAGCGGGRESERDYHTRHLRLDRLPREASPSAELEQRVSALHAELQRSQRRWTHARTT